MSQAMRKLTGAISKSKTCVIFINQIREKIGVMFGSPETTPGGRALEVLLLLPHRRPPHRPAQGGRRGRRPARAGQGGQEQGRPAVPRRRVRHDAHQRHQLRRRHARPGAWTKRSSSAPAPGSATATCSSARVARRARAYLEENPALVEELREKVMASGAVRQHRSAGDSR